MKDKITQQEKMMRKLYLSAICALSIGSAQAVDWEGGFWIQGYTGLIGDPSVTHWCGLMERFNQVDSPSSSTFEYKITWYTDTGELSRTGHGVVSNTNRDIDWIDDIDDSNDGAMYLRGEGARLTSTSMYWTGMLWDAKGKVGMRETEFWVLPLNSGDSQPKCNR